MIHQQVNNNISRQKCLLYGGILYDMGMIKNTIKVGDTIMYRGCFGSDAPKQVVVDGLTLTDETRSKYGLDVREVFIKDVKANRVLFSLNDGHWCYAEQVDC